MKIAIIAILFVLAILAMVASWYESERERAKELQLEIIAVIFMSAAFVLIGTI